MATTAATTITTTSTTGLGASSGAFSVVAGHSTNPEWGTRRQSHLLPRVESISDSDCQSSYSLIAQVGAYKITLILSAKVQSCVKFFLLSWDIFCQYFRKWQMGRRRQASPLWQH